MSQGVQLIDEMESRRRLLVDDRRGVEEREEQDLNDMAYVAKPDVDRGQDVARPQRDQELRDDDERKRHDRRWETPGADRDPNEHDGQGQDVVDQRASDG